MEGLMRFVLAVLVAATLLVLPAEPTSAQTCSSYTSSSGRWTETSCSGSGYNVTGTTWHSSSGRYSDTDFSGTYNSRPISGSGTTWHSSSGRSSDTDYTYNYGGRSYSGSFTCYDSYSGRYRSC
jgi:hypothetical protein